MTHEELLAKIGNPIDEGYQYGDIVFNKALRAVVELHQEYTTADGVAFCVVCRTQDKQVQYPCPTIQAIENELS